MSDLKPADAERIPKLLRVRNRILDAALKELDCCDVSTEELLAILAHTTGSVLAHQNPMKMSPEQAMEIVLQNMKVGNTETANALAARGGVPRGRVN